MNDRFVEIDSFLKRMANIYADSSYIDVYACLEMYDFSDEELRDYDTSQFFEHWQKHFASTQHIKTGFRMRGFLSFDSLGLKDYSCVKMYLSFPKEHLDEAVIKIFDYLDKKKIVTSSKVAAHLRSDEVVIRVASISDANLIMDFISNNRELSSWMKKTNPFVPRNGRVGVAYDEDLSYNSVVDDIMSAYLRLRKDEHALSKVGYDDFVSYVQQYYNRTFKSIDGIKNLLKESDFQSNYHRISGYSHCYTEGKLVLNYEKVCMMLLQSLDYHKTVNDYFALISRFQNKEQDYQMTRYYDTIINAAKQKETLQSLKKILDGYIIYLDNNNMDAKGILNSFLQQGNYYFITRENSYRSLFYYNNMLGAIGTLTNHNIDDYVSNIINLSKTKEEGNTSVKLAEEIKHVIDEYIEYGLTKYGMNIVCRQLNNFLLNGDYNLITRDHQLRDKFMSYQLERNIHQFFTGKVDSYVLNFSNELARMHTDALIRKNQDRKELLDEYIEYAIANYGVETTCVQLKGFMRTGNYNLITSSYNLRQRFQAEQMDLYIAGIVQLDIDKYVYGNLSVNGYESKGHITK